ncbi:hypothetical protein F3J16_10685 [Burkholderia sp. Ap-962]|uniref:hypothetical protein n=2 Tax=unclassified Burkholderia TaxID=2613784 RepID=UPI0014206B76|nr:hypothetical protein [Burkholderia sp. Ap-962]NIF70646.1 hypothetical protein [Burkholderia sp. Ap-962]
MRERQDAAPSRMEAALIEVLHLDHLRESGFAPAVLERLAVAGVTTFDQLLGLICRRRQQWYMRCRSWALSAPLTMLRLPRVVDKGRH